MNKLQRQIVCYLKQNGNCTGYDMAKVFKNTSHQQIYREIAKLVEKYIVVTMPIPNSGKPDRNLVALVKNITPTFHDSDFRNTEGAAKAVLQGTYQEYLNHMKKAEQEFFNPNQDKEQTNE